MKRLCLKCRHVFKSEGIHNRLCISCNRINQDSFFLEGLKVRFKDPGRHVVHDEHDALTITRPR